MQLSIFTQSAVFEERYSGALGSASTTLFHLHPFVLNIYDQQIIDQINQLFVQQCTDAINKQWKECDPMLWHDKTFSSKVMRST